MNGPVFRGGGLLLVALLLSTGRLASDPLPERLRQHADLAAAYLIGAIEPDGRFIYRRDAVTGRIDPSRYNLLRHAGTLYALAEYYGHYPPTLEQRRALERAAGFLTNCCIAPVADRSDLLAVWSPPELTGGGGLLQAKLGGAGLALVALVELEQVAPGSTDIDTLRALGRFVRYLQKPDGSFHSKYIPERGGRDDSWTSLYYPGEAALGLLRLYTLDSDPRWREAAIRALSYLARSRVGRTDVPADHWALLASAELLRQGEPAQDWLLEHAGQVVDAILSEQQLDLVAAEVRGGFAPDGRITPTATRLEGLLAALEFLPAGHRRATVKQAVSTGMAFLLANRIITGEFAGAVPRGGTGRRATEIRIDYVQHALGALLHYERRHWSAGSYR